MRENYMCLCHKDNILILGIPRLSTRLKGQLPELVIFSASIYNILSGARAACNLTSYQCNDKYLLHSMGFKRTIFS